ncbi:MAG TPA: flavin reductase family protein [Gaiellaceae bacterium]|nr:flavin reductase family protein [Gaiellaceae bacterium]
MDGTEFRRAMARWPTGVAVVTSRAGDGPRGATTNAFLSLSLEPPLVLVALELASNTLAATRSCGRFCVNVLAAGQDDLARRFATKATGAEKLAGVAHELVDGVPVLGGVTLWLACELERELEGGDHAILVGAPLDAGGDEAAQPLLFFGGRYTGGAVDSATA